MTLNIAEIAPLILVGAGNMGGAMLTGWIDRGIKPADVIVLDPGLTSTMAEKLTAKGIAHASAPHEINQTAGLLLIAVKPQAMDAVLPGLGPLVGTKTLLMSVAAGTTIATLSRDLRPAATVRVMPNTPAQVARSMSVAVSDRPLESAQKAAITALLDAIGAVAWVDDEADIDVVTGLSGSGPAYVFHMVEALTAAGIAEGLSPELAETLARQTIAGAGELLHQSSETAETLRVNVTSPGGTTAAGLSVLMNEAGGLTELMTATVAAAAARSRELAKN